MEVIVFYWRLLRMGGEGGDGRLSEMSFVGE